MIFTGERLTSAIGGQIAFEHFHRYCIARDLVVRRDVLDVASGEGYGAALLAGVARSVVGVDIDVASVHHARSAYMMPNLRFLQGDATRLPLPDACVDVVTSFETLEHVQDQEGFMLEVRRVLRPGGLLLVSTPDRHVYSAAGQPPNPYHVLELTAPEFRELLSRHFADHRILAQRAVIGSVMAPLDETQAGWRTYDVRGENLIEAQPGLSRAFYLLAAASDGELPALSSSLFAHNASIDDLLSGPGLLAQERQARAEAEQREAALRAEAEERAASGLGEPGLTSAEAEQERAARIATEAALQDARRHAAELAAHIEQIRTSTLWRLTAPLRNASHRFPSAARFARRAMRAGYWTLTGQLPRRLRERRAFLARGREAPDADLAAEFGLSKTPRPLPDPATIDLPASADPRVSIIVPTYGQVDYTLRCLASIAAAPPTTPFDVLVIDDAADDPRLPQLAKVRGLRLVRWPENRGFLRSCNDAAAIAKGELLFFLNNDTELRPDAVDALVRLLDARPDAGMVGSRLLYPDGRLQEAGGIVWRDGSAWNYGNGDDPRKPEYNYVREADYISGAAIMVPRARWEEMGGFDEAFLPAYCEDSDLAFRLRAAGWKVLYQPASVVIHHEGVSHGTDTGAGIKAHQVANTAKLHARWKEDLSRNAFPPGEHVMRARDRAQGRTVTLVIDHYVPEPDRDAGSRTILAFIDALVASGRCVKFLPVNLYRSPGYTETLQQRGVEVVHGPWIGSLDRWLELNGAEIDEVLLSRPSVAVELLPRLRAHCRAPIVFYGHDLHFARMQLVPGAMDSTARREEVEQMEALERRIWQNVDLAIYPSEEEAARVRELAPGVRARSVPAYAFPPAETRTEAAPPAGGLIFVGGFRHPPNVDAALWLVHEILPLVRQHHPGLPLAIVGSHPTPEVLALAGNGVDVTGPVSDEELGARYARARVAICPLRVGAGVKLKVVEAMQRGVPVVTTPVGAQGLPGLAEICDVGRTAAELAEATARLLSDDDLWLRRTAAQAAYVAERFSPEAMRQALDAAFAEARRPPGL
jgi:GT2 family glycosyltransferase/glycosyltransferase involved in cell wall biosynthesis